MAQEHDQTGPTRVVNDHFLVVLVLCLLIVHVLTLLVRQLPVDDESDLETFLFDSIYNGLGLGIVDAHMGLDTEYSVRQVDFLLVKDQCVVFFGHVLEFVSHFFSQEVFYFSKVARQF